MDLEKLEEGLNEIVQKNKDFDNILKRVQDACIKSQNEQEPVKHIYGVFENDKDGLLIVLRDVDKVKGYTLDKTYDNFGDALRYASRNILDPIAKQNKNALGCDDSNPDHNGSEHNDDDVKERDDNG